MSEVDLKKSEVDLNVSEVDLNECEHFLSWINLNGMTPSDEGPSLENIYEENTLISIID